MGAGSRGGAFAERRRTRGAGDRSLENAAGGRRAARAVAARVAAAGGSGGEGGEGFYARVAVEQRALGVAAGGKKIARLTGSRAEVVNAIRRRSLMPRLA